MLLITKLKQILKPELNSKSEEKEYRRRLVLIAGSLLLIGGIGLIIAENGFGWARTGFPNKTLWDWMQLLIIPVVLAIVAIWFNRVERKNERDIYRDNQQANALETYFDKMSDLLLKEDLRSSKSDAEVRKIARARTLSTLSQLDGTRKGSLLQFLYEADLIQNERCIISLVNADL